MNSANEMLMAIKNHKALITKERDDAIAYIEECYKRDMQILEKEEKELLSQFNDVQVNEIYNR